MGKIRAMVAFVPRYVADFGSVLIRPKRFIARRNVQGEETWKESLSFLACSVILTLLATIPGRPLDPAMVLHLAERGLSALLELSLFAVILWAAWAVVGGRSTVRGFAVTYAYFAGVIFVLFAVVLLVADVIVMVLVLEPEMYEAAREAADLGARESGRRLDEIGYWDRPAVMTGLALKVVGPSVAPAWALLAWGAFRQLNGVGEWRSCGALLIAGFLVYVAIAATVFPYGQTHPGMSD